MNKPFSTIAFVVPYFGRFNNYFQLWLDSCAANKTIDWLIFTDDRREFDYPKNVHVTYTTLENVCKRAEKTLNCHVCLDFPYKLCDLKPIYGVIFADELKEYDFWGYCDTDLIWGNIRTFIPEETLAVTDKIFSFGHCTIIRNCERTNNAFKMPTNGVDDYRKVVTEPYIFGYDESDEINMVFRIHFPNTFYEKCFCFDVNVSKQNFYPAPRSTVGIPGIRDAPYLFLYNKDKLIGFCLYDDELISKEFMYLHLQKRIMTNDNCKRNNQYIIVPNKFINGSEITVKDFSHYLFRHECSWLNFRRKIMRYIDAIFDSAQPKPYHRGRLQYVFDKLFGRDKRYRYPFMEDFLQNDANLNQ